MILLTGTTGKIGIHLVALLAKQHQKLRILARDLSKVAKYAETGAELVQGDLLDPATLTPAFKGVEKLFLLTDSNELSVEAQHNAIRAAKAAGVKHLVRVSAAGSSHDSPIRLARWHAVTDDEIKASGIDYTILYPGFFMQNSLGSVGSIKAQGMFFGATKDAKIAIIDARDIAAAAAAALTGTGHANKSYNLTGGEAISQQEIAAKLSKKVGKTVTYVDLPVADLVKGMQSAGLPAWYAQDLGTMNGWFATGQAAAVDPTLSTLIGRKPYTYDDFLDVFGASFQ